jgi:hypothetical protein
MDMNNTPEPRMPLVENLKFLDLMGVISSLVQCQAPAFEPRLADTVGFRGSLAASVCATGQDAPAI